MTLDEAKEQARKSGYFIVVKPDCFLLYSQQQPRNVFVAKRKEEKAIISLVRKLTVDKTEKPS